MPAACFALSILCGRPALFAANNVSPAGLLAEAPQATASLVDAHYCFASAHGLLPERLPVPPLVLKLRVQISYFAIGSRPLILPLDHDLTVYTSLAPGVMKVLPKAANLFEPRVREMAHLPPDVNPDNPIAPKNDVFTLVPAGDGPAVAIVEEIMVPIYRKSLRRQTDLRGRRLYLRLQLDHQPLSPDLQAVLSDRWTRLGIPWTGRVLTNTLVFDVPASPSAVTCVDVRQ